MSQRLRFVPTASVTALIALAAAGCGGGGSSPPSSSVAEVTQPTKTYAALVAAADPICKKIAVKSAKANASLAKVSGSAAKTLLVLARVVPRIAKEDQKAVKALGALEQSGSQTQDWHTMLLYLRELANNSAELATAAKAENLLVIHVVTARGQAIQKKLGVIAKRDGFAYCGRGN